MPLDFLAEGAWLQEERTVNYSRIFVCAYIAAIVVSLGLSHGLIDANGKPIGTDFMGVWAAGKLALAGEPGAAYDYMRHYEVQRQALPWRAGQDVLYIGWHYSPVFLLVAAPLALLSYGTALSTWLAVTLPAYLTVMRAIIPSRRWLLFALAFPAVLVNIGHGQNGFFTTGLLGGGLLLLESHPVTAGIFFGLLSYKPQFGILLPLALIAGRHWRVLIAASLTTAGSVFLSAAVLGADVWQAFFDSLHLTRTYVLEQGPTGWEKIQSVFSAVRMLGGSIDFAYAVQGIVSLCVAVSVLWAWRPSVSIPLKGAILTTASLMATPYVLDYDLMLLALPIAWLAAEGVRAGFFRWEKAILVGAWLLPILSRQIGALGVPIAPFMLSLLLIALLSRAADRSAHVPARRNDVRRDTMSTPQVRPLRRPF